MQKGGEKIWEKVGSSNRILNLLEETTRTKVAEIKGTNKEKKENKGDISREAKETASKKSEEADR